MNLSDGIPGGCDSLVRHRHFLHVGMITVEIRRSQKLAISFRLFEGRRALWRRFQQLLAHRGIIAAMRDRNLLALRIWFTMIALVCLGIAQSPPKPARTIVLPYECQHPSFRQLYEYDGGQRLGFNVHSDFCRIDAVSGQVRRFHGYGQIDEVRPAPKGRLVAMVHQSSHLVVLNDDARVQFDEDLKSDDWKEIYWTRDQSHLVLFDVDDFGTQDAAAIIDLSTKSVKTIRFDPPALVRFDANTSTIRADRVSGKNQEGLVYDLNGNLLRHAAPRTPSWNVDSANRKYTYIFRYEIGGGDISIREAANGPALFRLPEHKSLKSRFFGITPTGIRWKMTCFWLFISVTTRRTAPVRLMSSQSHKRRRYLRFP